MSQQIFFKFPNLFFGKKAMRCVVLCGAGLLAAMVPGQMEGAPAGRQASAAGVDATFAPDLSSFGGVKEAGGSAYGLPKGTPVGEAIEFIHADRAFRPVAGSPVRLMFPLKGALDGEEGFTIAFRAQGDWSEAGPPDARRTLLQIGRRDAENGVAIRLAAGKLQAVARGVKPGGSRVEYTIAMEVDKMALGAGQWHHFAVTYEPASGQMTLFVDGEKKGMRAGIAMDARWPEDSLLTVGLPGIAISDLRFLPGIHPTGSQ